MDNQFINAPLLLNRSALLAQKDQQIQKLQQKNTKLKQEILKIQQTIQQKFTIPEATDLLPKKRESIFQTEDNYEVLNKELANTYKRIKMYQYEIGKLEDNQKGVNMSQKSNHYDGLIKEKRTMIDKLKHQFIKEQKSVQNNNKKLQKNAQQNQLQGDMKKLTEQLKFYKEKVKDLEQKEAMKTGNMKKQYEAIKRFQTQLLQAGVAGGQLQDMKRNAIKNFATGATRKGMNQSKMMMASGQNSEEEIEDRTRQNYQALLGEVALLEKMQHDHERQTIQAFEDKVEAMNKNLHSRNRLLECENEIENLQKEIQIMKGKVVPSNMKPLRPLRSFSSHQPQNPQKLLPAKSLFSSPQKHKSLIHILKYDQVGMPSPKGQRFTDRLLLGKNNLSAKITSVRVYLDKNTNLIAGLQLGYSGNKKGGEHVRKDKDQRQKQYKEEEIVCRGSSFIRSIAGTLNTQDRLQFVQLTSSDGSSFRAGMSTAPQKSFNLQISPNEYPTCVFGSLVVVKQPGKKQYSYIEHIGFEIQNDNLNSSSAVINEFDM